MVYTLACERKGPAAIRFPRDKAINGDERPAFELIDLEAWEVLEAPAAEVSSPVVLLCYGAMVDAARQALPALKQSGIEPYLVNARSAKPLDESLLESFVFRCDTKIVTLEEGCLAGGFGAAVLEWAAAQRARRPREKQAEIACLGIGDHFVEHGARAKLLEINGLSPERIAEFVRQFSQVD